ncbi:hypothetical protein HYS92_00175 [Candidatus Daviesbacteria bacterium]|nr:hypothetical protein [Candidatus Daviesbacteria bacterium]
MTIIELTSIASAALLLITAIVAGIYAYFTLGIWRTSIKQTKQSLMPLPVIYRRKITDTQRRVHRVFRIRNIGYGAALNIEIENFYLRIKGKKIDKTYKYVLSMSDPNILVKDEEKDLIYETYLNNELMQNWDLSAYLDPEFANHNIPIKITYQDITGRKYSLKIAFGTGKLSIIQFPSESKIEGFLN